MMDAMDGMYFVVNSTLLIWEMGWMGWRTDLSHRHMLTILFSFDQLHNAHLKLTLNRLPANTPLVPCSAESYLWGFGDSPDSPWQSLDMEQNARMV